MLHVSNLALSYGAAQALRSVTIEVPENKVTCVLGRNGVGKTSLLRAIIGQIKAQAGQIIWNGEDISKIPSEARARQGLAYVPQGREIFPLLTVRENLQTGLFVRPRRDRTIPDEIFELFPVLKEMLKRRGGDLSGGQQQQLAIARALITQPKLLILDEPTEGIQPSIIKDIERVIRLLRERGGMSILLVEQYFDFAAALADTFAVMDRGEIVMAGEMQGANESAILKHLTI
ncbi:MAG: urea ABC transporter ATP-binding subunit UrtE [Rhizobiales bacterium]|nr:urea ABC transporter ATP-binding subunit UrtE [Hyphomicrobiales bacterium]